MDKKHQKCPQNGFFPLFATLQDFFFKNRALSLLYPYSALASCKKLEKTNDRSLRYSQTDYGLLMEGLRTDRLADNCDYYLYLPNTIKTERLAVYMIPVDLEDIVISIRLYINQCTVV